MVRLRKKPTRGVVAAVAILLLSHAVVPAQGQPDALYQREEQLPWRTAPDVLHIQSVAVLDPGPDLKFLDPDATSTLLVLNDNPPENDRYAVAPANLAWWSVFSYGATGHVSDNDSIEPDAVLATLKAQNERDRDARRKAGLPDLLLEGWSVPPHYDAATHNLEWGTRLASDGQQIINYTVRILGREGVVRAVLVTDPTDFSHDLGEFRAALQRVTFVQGQSYAEFHQGDKIAGYGLVALIAGGAAAAAASSGALKGLVKVVAFAVFGAAAAVAGLFKKLLGRRK